MSRDCRETGRTLVTPHVELELIINHMLVGSAGVNVSAFEKALGFVLPTSSYEFGPLPKPKTHYLIYGVVGRIVNTHQWPYLNIGEPAISRTLMGYVTEEIIKKELPKTFEEFRNIKRD